jgi:hypothetical protein
MCAHTCACMHSYACRVYKHDWYILWIYCKKEGLLLSLLISYYRRYTDWGCFRTGCWVEYLDLRRMKWQDTRKNCIMSFIIWISDCSLIQKQAFVKKHILTIVRLVGLPLRSVYLFLWPEGPHLTLKIGNRLHEEAEWVLSYLFF